LDEVVRATRAALWLLVAAPLSASAQDLLASGTLGVSTAKGSVTLVSRLYDAVPDAPDRWRFEYELSGDFDPFPGDSNGLSSLQILFAGLLSDVEDPLAPEGWQTACCLTSPPFGVGFDLDNTTGPGVGPGSNALFSFTTPAGIPWTDAPSGSYAGSHVEDVPAGFVDLVDDETGAGPIVPAPEPTAPALGAAATALAAARGRRRRASR
jgi:hypothetical protein